MKNNKSKIFHKHLKYLKKNTRFFFMVFVLWSVFVSFITVQNYFFNDSLVSFGVIWFVGSLGILLVYFQVKSYLIENNIFAEKVISNEKRYKALFQNMISGCIVLERRKDDFIIKAINHKALMFEKMENKDLVGKSIKMIINDKVNSDLLSSMEMVYSSEDPLTISEFYFDNGITAGWRKYQFYILNSGELVIIYRDISEEYEREVNLKILRQAVEQSTSLIGITDKDGNLTYVNPIFMATTEYSWNELIGENTRILNSGEQSGELYKNLWDTISNGDTWTGEFHNKTKTGKLYWESANISPIFDKKGNISHYIKIGEDITLRKMALDALRASENRYRSIVEASYDAMVMTKNDEIIYFNKAFMRLTRYEFDELQQKKMNELITKSKLKIEELSEGVIRKEGTMRRADGSSFEAEMIATEIQYQKSKSLFLIIRDITEQKSLMKTLQQTIENTKSLEGLIPICASCKKIRDDDKETKPWKTPEEYIHERLPNVDFTHTVCPDCLKDLYPELWEKKFGSQAESGNG